ncbi:Beta-barrel assembly-enhancing protease [Thalassocella blandensis]|nr:Beta-barrel assembly-enhancing protease [Thalassocella blandensis]
MHSADADPAGSSRIKQLEKYLDLDPSNINILLDIVRISVQTQNWDLAEKYIEFALSQFPESSEVQAFAGIHYLRLNQLDLATEYFSRAIDNGIDNTGLKYNLAFAYYLQSNMTKSISVLENILESEDNKREILTLYARCMHHSEQLERGIELLTSYNNSNPMDTEVNGLLAIMLYDNGNYDDAFKLSNQVLSHDDANLEALVTRGGVNIERQNYYEAFADYKRAVSSHPSNGRAWSGLGQLHFYNLQIEDAIECLSNAVEYMPNHIGTWHVLAWAYLLSDKVDEAESAFENSYKLDRNFAETHGGLASVYALKGDIEIAQKHIKIAERLDGNGFSAVYAKLVLLNREGKQSEANALFEQVKNSKNETLGIIPRIMIEKRLNEIQQEHSANLN